MAIVTNRLIFTPSSAPGFSTGAGETLGGAGLGVGGRAGGGGVLGRLGKGAGVLRV